MLKTRLSYLIDNRYFELFVRIAWLTSIFLLPITSFPALVEVFGATTVAPPSIILITMVTIVWVLPVFLVKGSLPIEIGPFLIFLIAALISWGLSFFLRIPPYRDHTIYTEYKSALLTLISAGVVYITATMWISGKIERIRLTMQAVSLSGLILILWSFVQAYFVIFQDGAYPRVILQLQSYISSRNGTWLFADRVTGMAYEPSWLAHQLVLVFIPMWLSATINNYSAFSRRLLRVSVENILLIGGILVLFLSFSRIGWISFLLMAAYAAIHVNLKLTKIIQAWLKKRFGGAQGKVFSWVSTSVVVGLIGLGYLGLAVGAVYLGASLEPRLAKILATDFSRTTSFFDLINHLFFAERAVYWFAGLDVFNAFPWLGAGLGNSGFFFPKTMPAFGFGLTEIQNLFYRFNFLPNTKSMWVRLFAETGFIGFSLFITWLFMIFQSSRLAKKFGSAEMKVFGWMGQFVLVAYLAEGFSLDSFAMPYIWLSLGLASAAAVLTRNKVKYQADHNLLGRK